jgi:hypothetical protein
MKTQRAWLKKVIIMVGAVVLIAPLFSVLSPAVSPAAAADAAAFNPGNIISDALFYDGGALTAGQVESFLQSHISGTCQSGYTCLKDYTQSTANIARDSYCPGGYVGSGSERAADIIAKVGASCNISQRALIVLLEKEESLVSLRNPLLGRYDSATGFGCPDTAACDPNVAGFFYQVYYAARQFQNYAQNPTHWNYQPGRVNSILYGPPPCGTRGDVFIQNKATAGLYIYTPYQPSPAVLANLYGTAPPDACNAYGNRNFWRIFTDWFGPTTDASSLLRTVDNGTLYVVAGSMKYPIASGSIWAVYFVLGQVGYVSQQYLDSLTTSHLAGRTIRDPGGTIYFIDSGIKLPLTSCAQAADYGASCADTGYVQLTDVQASAFSTGPVLSNVLGTIEGARYYIHAGTKSEILDDQSQLAAGIPIGMNVLTENAVSDLPLIAPIVRDGVYSLARGASSYSLISQGNDYAVASGDESALGVSSRTAGTLWPASIALIPQGGSSMSGYVSSAGTTSLISSTGRLSVSGGAVPSHAAPAPVSSTFLSSYPDQGQVGPGSFIKSPTSGSVYVIMPSDIRPISSWDSLLALTPNGNPTIEVVPQAYIASLATGPTALTAGTLVRSPQDATVYYVNGVTNRIALSSFEFTTEAGFSNLLFVSQALIDAYPLAPQSMTFGFSCGADDYMAAGGGLHKINTGLVPSYPLEYVALDQFSCQQATKGIDATSFIRTPEGSIYQIVAGEKRPISTMIRFAQLAGNATYITVAPQFAAIYPTGAAA